MIGGTTVGAITVPTISATVTVGATTVGTITIATAVGTTAVATAVGTTAVGAIAVSTAVGTTAVGAIAAAIYRGSNDVSVRGRLVANAVTHPMAVLATEAAGPFESQRCPADPGHVSLSPAPFTVGHRAVGRGRRFLLGPSSGVGTAVEWPPETEIRRQRV